MFVVLGIKTEGCHLEMSTCYNIHAVWVSAYTKKSMQERDWLKLTTEKKCAWTKKVGVTESIKGRLQKGHQVIGETAKTNSNCKWSETWKN